MGVTPRHRAGDFQLIITYSIGLLTFPEKNPVFGSRMANQQATHLESCFNLAPFRILL